MRTHEFVLRVFASVVEPAADFSPGSGANWGFADFRCATRRWLTMMFVSTRRSLATTSTPQSVLASLAVGFVPVRAEGRLLCGCTAGDETPSPTHRQQSPLKG